MKLPARLRKFRATVAVTFMLVGLVALTGCRGSSADFMARGKKLAEQKQYERAVLEFKNAARLQPKSAEPYYQEALAYLAAGENQAAADSLLTASQIDPKHPGVQLKLAEVMAINKDGAIARQGETRAQALLKEKPRSSDAVNALAVAEFRLGKTEAALAHFRQAVAESPGNVSSAVNLAVVQFAKGDAAAAETTLRGADARNPGRPELKLALGRMYLAAARPGEAEREFKKVASLDPGYSPALIDLAALYVRTGRLTDADRTYQNLASLPDARLRAVHALFLEQQNQFEAAIPELNDLYRKDKADREIRTLLADAYLRTEQTGKAQPIIDAALKANPNDADALEERSEIYLRAQRYPEARRDLYQVLHERPDSAQAHYGLARIYHSQHELSERQELSEALRLDPNMVAARIDLAQYSMLHEGAAASLEVLNQAPPTQRDNLELAIQRNTALLALGKTAELRSNLDRSLAVARRPEVLVQDGLLRIKLRDFAGARKAVREALEKQPDDLAALETLSLTYAAQNEKETGLRAVQEHVSRHGSSAPALVFLGQLQKTGGRREEARATLLEATAKDPGFEPAGVALAQMDIEDGQGEKARRLLQRLALTHGEDAVVHVQLGMADELTSRFGEAVEEYRRAVDLDAKNVIALNNLACLLAERNHQPDEALRWAQMASQAAPDDPNVADTLGWIYFRQGLYKNAVQQLQLAARSNLPITQYHLGMAYLKAGDTDRGQQLLGAVLKAHPQLAAQGLPN